MIEYFIIILLSLILFLFLYSWYKEFIFYIKTMGCNHKYENQGMWIDYHKDLWKCQKCGREKILEYGIIPLEEM